MVTDTVFQTEHGPRGGDELNIIEPAKNYGWPAITYGIDYSGLRISPYTSHEGMEQPLEYWDPSFGPSGMTVYRGDAFPDWDGDIFMTSLVFNHVIRVDMDGRVSGAQQISLTRLAKDCATFVPVPMAHCTFCRKARVRATGGFGVRATNR